MSKKSKARAAAKAKGKSSGKWQDRLPSTFQWLKTVKAAEADPRVFINGDEKAEFGKAVAVLDEARKLGISKVAIETKSK